MSALYILLDVIVLTDTKRSEVVMGKGFKEKEGCPCCGSKKLIKVSKLVRKCVECSHKYIDETEQAAVIRCGRY